MCKISQVACYADDAALIAKNSVEDIRIELEQKRFEEVEEFYVWVHITHKNEEGIEIQDWYGQ